MSLLDFTGHPFIDVGVATIMAHAGVDDPTQVTEAHLDDMADLLERTYSDGFSRNFYGSVIFANSGFSQPAFNAPKFRYKRQAYATIVLRGHQNRLLQPLLDQYDNKLDAFIIRGMPGRDARCAFTGKPAYIRATREMFPLLNGRTVINFSPNGQVGIPVSDVVLLAIHAMPLGCIASQGRLLAVTSDDKTLLLGFARENLEENSRYLQMTSLESMPNAAFFRTRLLERLVKITGAAARADVYPSLTAYHFSNSGQDARIDIYTLPSPVVEFVAYATRRFPGTWAQIAATAWDQKKASDEELLEARPKFSRRNLFYEDLFDLPDNARAFLSTYLLRRALSRFKDDPRAAYHTLHDHNAISWDFTAAFLKGIFNMEKARIDSIRKLGDRLAEYILHFNDRRLLREMYYARGNEYWKFRSALIRAAQRPDKNNANPLVEFDVYVSVFEEGEEAARLDWQLARDLVMIRIVEQLHRANWFATNTGALEPEDEEQAVSE